MTEINKKNNSQRLCEVIVEEMQNKNALDIVIIDLREIENAVTDYFVIASGRSTTQVSGIADAIVRSTRKELKEKPWHEEGKNNSQWILLDYVDVVAHIFHEEVRQYYEIEDLWADGKTRRIENN